MLRLNGDDGTLHRHSIDKKYRGCFGRAASGQEKCLGALASDPHAPSGVRTQPSVEKLLKSVRTLSQSSEWRQTKRPLRMLTTLSGLSVCCWTVSFTKLILSTAAGFQQRIKKAASCTDRLNSSELLLQCIHILNAVALVLKGAEVGARKRLPAIVLALILRSDNIVGIFEVDIRHGSVR